MECEIPRSIKFGPLSSTWFLQGVRMDQMTAAQLWLHWWKVASVKLENRSLLDLSPFMWGCESLMALLQTHNSSTPLGFWTRAEMLVAISQIKPEGQQNQGRLFRLFRLSVTEIDKLRFQFNPPWCRTPGPPCSGFLLTLRTWAGLTDTALSISPAFDFPLHTRYSS